MKCFNLSCLQREKPDASIWLMAIDSMKKDLSIESRGCAVVPGTNGDLIDLRLITMTSCYATTFSGPDRH